MELREAAEALAGILRGKHSNLGFAEAFAVCLRATRADAEVLAAAVRTALGDDAYLADAPAEVSGSAKE